jgi:tetratricopeptide (TPR) repeat protein
VRWRGTGGSAHAPKRVTLLEHALKAAELAGDRVQSYWALHSLAELELHLGNLDAAAPLFARSAGQAEETGDRPLLTYVFHGMGDVALAQNDFREAAASYRRSLRLSIELGELRTPPACVAGLAVAAASGGDTKQAGELWGAVSTLERELGFPLHPFERARYNKLIRAHADTHPAAFADAVERGQGMTVNDIYAEALTGC